MDYYGRVLPKHAHGSVNLRGHTASSKEILEAVSALFDRIVDPNLLVRRLNLTANHVIGEASVLENPIPEQLTLFSDYAETEAQEAERRAALARERRMQQALLGIRRKYGKNAILKGMSFEEGATAKERNEQIGGHKA